MKERPGKTRRIIVIGLLALAGLGIAIAMAQRGLIP
jgi:hypothetical protein